MVGHAVPEVARTTSRRRTRPHSARRVLRGRESELAGLVTILDTAITAGRGTVVSVVARAGMGKTALITEMEIAAVARGFRTAWSGPGDDFRPDTLAGLLGDADTEITDPRLVLERRLARGPLLISLDDFEWDEPAVRTLGMVFSLVTTRPLVCVLAHRSGRHAFRLERLFRFSEDREAMVYLPLGRLPDDVAVAVVSDVLGATPDAALTAVVACAEGNAAALVRLAGWLVREGLVRCENGVARLTHEITATSQSTPASECVDTLVRCAFDALSPQTRQALDVAAVLGRTFAPDDVAEMLRQPVAVLAPALREALTTDVLDCAAEKMRFRHDLVWQSVLRSIPVPVRSALHTQAARMLLARGDSVIDSAGHLLRGAVRGDTATVEVLRAAAEQTLRSSPRAAAELAVRALELMVGDSEEWLPLTMIAVEACARGGPLSTAVELASGAIARDVPPAAAAMLRYWLSTALTLQDRPADAAEVAAGLFSCPGVPADLSRRLLLNRSMAVTVRGGPPTAPPGADQVIMPASGPMAAWQAGMVTAALRMSRDAVLAEEVRFPVTWLGHPRLARAAILTGLRDIEGARAAVAAVEQDVDYTLSALPTLMRARLDLAIGRSASAVAEATECLALARETGVRLHLPAALAVLTTVALRRGDRVADASGDALVQWAAAEVAGTRAVALEWAWAQSALAQEDYHGCLRVLEWISRDDDSCRALFVEEPAAAAWIVRTALAMGRRDWAMRAADTADRLAQDDPDVASVVVAAAHARGLLHDDVEALAQAAGGHEDLWARASAAEDLGEALLIVDREAAVQRLEDAVALYVSVEAERDAARGRRRLRALGVVKRHWQRRDALKTGIASLTETEQTVVSLVAEGLTNRQVASRMFISRHTVAFHLRKVFRKLDISSRVQLAHHIQFGTD
ncbi:helix-turn-helix transcriptional regulator [Frankia sp. Cas4]|uniref:helix-turn-helix transcriptional regulator n=1 Tax=Frankia sp. Cas4 TaxID=3073927 RepID=UPI002AD242DD|nr:LuxR C-terminal-related transcriptional regulator [Frankia sp. Cas4]